MTACLTPRRPRPDTTSPWRTFSLLLCLSWMQVIPAFAQTSTRLPASVQQALRQADIPDTAVAVVVQDVAKKRARLRLHAEQAFNPASLMKLLTTHAALEILGPDKVWQTTLLSHRLPQDGVLNDDLILRGSGDPALTLEKFWLLLHRLRAHGVRDIRGKLILDRSLFDTPPPDDAFDAQPLRPYNVTPDALLLNLKALRLQLTPAPAQGRLDVLAEPHPDNLDILNRIELVPSTTMATMAAMATPPTETDCLPGKNGLHASFRAATETTRAQLHLEGRYPADCGTQRWSLAPLKHPDYVFGVFQQLWKEMGGKMTGQTVTVVRDPPGNTPAPALLPLLPLAELESPPLRQIIIDINKHSNNVMARQVFLALGPAEDGPLNPALSETVLRRWLNKKGLDCPQLILENGAGLSRHERLDADCLARLLIDAWQSPLMPEFLASLPIVGVDGTMKKRLADTPLRGQAHIKTGSLENVRTLAGYVRDAQGHWKIVVFLINHPKAAESKTAQDALLQWVHSAK